jgi:hypothetical protein
VEHVAADTHEDWVVVPFHTLPEDELSEERPDANDAGSIRRRTYVG